MAQTESREGNVLLAPGYDQKAEVKGSEILFSTVGVLQKGVTLVSGQGVLPAGTPLEYVGGSKKYQAATVDANVKGFLRFDVDTGTVSTDTSRLGNIVLAGSIKTASIPLTLPAGADYTAAGLATALGGVVNTQFGYLKF